jgi:Uma2 family endonuclease
VALELDSSTKHEFFNGEIYAMAGGSEEHSALAAEVLGAFRDAVRDGPRRVHTSDLRVYVEAAGLATFPDGSVICDPFEQHEPSPKATALNPTVLLEVTSDSSEEYDTVDKVEHYRTIPSLREYVIVSHRERRISVHTRSERGEWTKRVAIAGGSVPVESLKLQLAVDEVYRKSSVR